MQKVDQLSSHTVSSQLQFLSNKSIIHINSIDEDCNEAAASNHSSQPSFPVTEVNSGLKSLPLFVDREMQMTVGNGVQHYKLSVNPVWWDMASDVLHSDQRSFKFMEGTGNNHYDPFQCTVSATWTGPLAISQLKTDFLTNHSYEPEVRKNTTFRS